ncbi:hypothetical protein HYD_5210 [Candidatus Hydrogenosomobacter endosymbioticus]|uniref:Phosphatidate cytidylyltransferase n=2 Tax=Candidatus Hydrogenosomobacter endosymbioticus TaxID=2558174 RepID=A0ABM7VA36_9PROT|nr:hypothetical protein HYD_5210 [Candidatus Hydrogenosomobacter endosymbioticus]
MSHKFSETNRFKDLRERVATSFFFLAAFAVFYPIYDLYSNIALYAVLFLLGTSAIVELFILFRRLKISLYLFAHLAIAIVVGYFGFVKVFLSSGMYQVVAVFLIAVISDVSAYFFGNILGGKKLCPTISPNKTVSGFICAVITASFICSIILIIGKTKTSGIIIKPVYIVAVCTALSIFAQIGDLAQSYMKRRAGIKDTSKAFPGHGGILDRTDSWIAVGIAALFLWPRIVIHQQEEMRLLFIDDKKRITRPVVDLLYATGLHTKKFHKEQAHGFRFVSKSQHIKYISQILTGRKYKNYSWIYDETRNKKAKYPRLASAKQYKYIYDICSRDLHMTKSVEAPNSEYKGILLFVYNPEILKSQICSLKKLAIKIQKEKGHICKIFVLHINEKIKQAARNIIRDHINEDAKKQLVEIDVINTRKDEYGSKSDAIHSWIYNQRSKKYRIEYGSYAVVSSSPYIWFDKQIVYNVCKISYPGILVNIDGIGDSFIPSINTESDVKTLLDATAKTIKAIHIEMITRDLPFSSYVTNSNRNSKH